MKGNTEETRAVAEAMYAAALAGDMEGAVATMSDDVVIYEPRFLPWGRVCRGKPAFVQLLADIGTHLSMPSLVLERLVVDGDMAVSYMSGKTLKGTPILASERSTIRDGKIVEITVFYYDCGELVPDAV